MPTLLNPALLWGLLAIAVPILIHLLLRQRPKPRPWAAMTWLLAASQVATRRWRLTNLLLLILRCIAIGLIVFALTRPSSNAGHGGHLLVILDTTASMGPQRDSGGALTEAIQQLRATSVPHRRITLVSVGADTVVRAETNPSELNDALSRITSEPIPGGIDRAAGPDGLSVIRPLVDDQTDLVLVSTFAKTPEPHSSPQ